MRSEILETRNKSQEARREMEDRQKQIDSLYIKEALRDCIDQMIKNKEADAYSGSCGELCLDNYEELQVQIIVTRKKTDFIGPFDIVEHKTYEPKKQ